MRTLKIILNNLFWSFTYCMKNYFVVLQLFELNNYYTYINFSTRIKKKMILKMMIIMMMTHPHSPIIQLKDQKEEKENIKILNI